MGATLNHAAIRSRSRLQNCPFLHYLPPNHHSISAELIFPGSQMDTQFYSWPDLSSKSAPWHQPVSGSWSLLSHPIKKMQFFHVAIFQSLFPMLFPPALQPTSWLSPCAGFSQFPEGVISQAWVRQEDAGTPGKPSYCCLRYLRGLLLLSLSPARIAKQGGGRGWSNIQVWTRENQGWCGCEIC